MPTPHPDVGARPELERPPRLEPRPPLLTPRGDVGAVRRATIDQQHIPVLQPDLGVHPRQRAAVVVQPDGPQSTRRHRMVHLGIAAEQVVVVEDERGADVEHEQAQRRPTTVHEDPGALIHPDAADRAEGRAGIVDVIAGATEALDDRVPRHRATARPRRWRRGARAEGQRLARRVGHRCAEDSVPPGAEGRSGGGGVPGTGRGASGGAFGACCGASVTGGMTAGGASGAAAVLTGGDTSGSGRPDGRDRLLGGAVLW